VASGRQRLLRVGFVRSGPTSSRAAESTMPLRAVSCGCMAGGHLLAARRTMRRAGAPVSEGENPHSQACPRG
jgi:hypothetical protein